jgi:hypothetical protein
MSSISRSISAVDGNVAHLDQRRRFLATALATRRQQVLALTIAGVTLVAFLALVPFVRVPLARMPAFIPSYEAALFFIDLITAVLLYDQSIRLRSAGILALASGYLFDAMIIVAHALSFPGAFAPTGLLGAKEQTTAWLYVFWHGGFPLFVIAYAWLRHRETSGRPLWKLAGAPRAILASVAGILTLVAALALLATRGHDWLPEVMRGSDYSLLVSKGISPSVWGLTLLAMVALWQRPQRVVDLWLMLVMWIWLFDIALSAVIGSTRFDLGFYAGRVFGLIAASFLLVTLVMQMAHMYAGALGAAASAEQRVAELARMRGRPKVGAAPVRGEPTDAFIRRQNVARYRALLEAGTLDAAQRRSIERLLAEEEAKDRTGALPA